MKKTVLISHIKEAQTIITAIFPAAFSEIGIEVDMESLYFQELTEGQSLAGYAIFNDKKGYQHTLFGYRIIFEMQPRNLYSSVTLEGLFAQMIVANMLRADGIGISHISKVVRRHPLDDLRQHIWKALCEASNYLAPYDAGLAADVKNLRKLAVNISALGGVAISVKRTDTRGLTLQEDILHITLSTKLASGHWGIRFCGDKLMVAMQKYLVS